MPSPEASGDKLRAAGGNGDSEPAKGVGFAESHSAVSAGGTVSMGAKSYMLGNSETLRQVAIFANNIAMEDDEIKSDKGDDHNPTDLDAPDEYANETGAERLQRALTTESKHKGLFRYTNTLGTAAGIEPDVLMRVALEDEWQMVSCASLPFTIVFFVIFMFFFQLHYGVTDIFLAEAALRTKLATPATEISEAIKIYDWLEDSYFPFLWAAKKETAQGIQVQLNSESLYQDIIAGVRLTTTNAKKMRCKDDLVGYMDCFSKYENVVMDGNGIFGNPPLPSMLLPRRMGGAMENTTETGADREAAWYAHQNAQAAERESARLKRQKAEDEKNLPVWARPGLSEGFRKYQSSRDEELCSAHRVKRRTAAAHDWRQVSAPLPAASLAAGGRAHSRDQMRPPPVGWRLGHSPARSTAGWLPSKRERKKHRRLKVNRPEIRPMTPRLTEGNKSELIIPISWTLEEVLAEVQRWRKIKVIKDTTLTFATQALILNKNLGHDMLSSVSFEFSIHRGGNVFTEVKIMSLVLTTVGSSAAQCFLAIAWVICLLAFSLILCSRAFLRWRQGRLASHFLCFWNLVEWAIISWGWLVFLLFIIERSMIWNIKTDIQDYRKERAKTPPWDHYAMDTTAVRSLLDTSTNTIDLASNTQLVVALFHIILVCRFFLASRGQPRLAVVLSTIRKASVDLFHLLIVFMIIFIAYAVSGHILFGRRLQEFATFQGAFARCFQIVMEREYTWTSFTEEDLWTATIWVWSFLLLVVLVLVNIFLAMIFDTYGDVRSSVGHSATLWQTTKIVLTHLKHTFTFGSESQKWVPNRELVKAVKAMQCQYVTPWMVKDAFPGISNRQVNYIFNLGKNRLETMLLRGNKSSLPAVIASILLGVERMHQGLQMMETNSQKKVSAVKKEREQIEEDRKSGTPVKSSGANAISPPDEPPRWIKVQLLPHFQKQKNLLTQVHVQIQRIERAMHFRGQSDDIPPPPGATPKNLKVRDVFGAAGAVMQECGPSSATSAACMLPSGVRGGLTAPGEDSPKNSGRPKKFNQPGG